VSASLRRYYPDQVFLGYTGSCVLSLGGTPADVRYDIADAIMHPPGGGCK